MLELKRRDAGGADPGLSLRNTALYKATIYRSLSITYLQYAEQEKSAVSADRIEKIGFLEGK